MQKCELTGLQLFEIVSLNHSVKTIIKKKDLNKCDLSNEVIKADFEIQNKDDEINVFRVRFIINIGPKRDCSGYKIFSEVEAYFSVPLSEDEEEVNQEKIKFSRSAVAMVISYLRSYIKTLTYNCPFGKYTLPAIDLPKLFDDVMITKQVSNSNNDDEGLNT